jgi:GNAT superfamily N-acetyltransferase
MRKNKVIIDYKTIHNEIIEDFFKAYNSSIKLEDDKDSKKDFKSIINSSDETAQFGVAYIKINNKIVSGTFYVAIKIPKDKQEIWKTDIAIIIIYTFTLENYRRKGYSYTILNELEIYFSKYRCIWFCEVLDENKLTNKQLKEEQKYADITCSDREKFWTKVGFNKCIFNYYNPLPDLSKNCNGIIDYNGLWVKVSFYDENHKYILKELALFALYSYFKYGYLAGNSYGHKWEAYKKNKHSIEKIKGNSIEFKKLLM